MKPLSGLNKFFSKLPIHLALIFMCLVWVLPTLGLFVTSFRPKEAVRTSGWWTVFTPAKPPASAEYDQYCASCHGPDGKMISNADLTDPAIMGQYTRSYTLLAMLKKDINGQPHVQNPSLPENPNESLAALEKILVFTNSISTEAQSGNNLTLSNYTDALVGYKGTNTYEEDCKTGGAGVVKFKCNASDLLNPEGMGRAFLNSLLVSVPTTILVVLLAASAAYAFAWLDFKGRQWLFALLVGLQIIPLQMTLVPISKLYASLGMQSTFLGIWLFHTGFGLPYAIYLMRNFIGSLPREIIESSYLDGANHWATFRRLVLPLTVPAIASLGIFQFLWV